MLATFSLITIPLVIYSNSTIAQEKSDDSGVIKVLRKFYTAYISEIANNEGNEKQLQKLKQQFCTNALIKKIENAELDYDPIINAQDADTAWLKSLEISKDKQKELTYTISYIDIYDQKKTVVTIKIKKVKESYKIDSIEGI